MIKIDDTIFLLNSKLSQQDLGKIRIKNPSYHPDTKFPLNRTVLHLPTGTMSQMSIWFNLCDIVVRNDFDNFKNYLLKPIVKFMINSVKIIPKAKIVNEMEFKINFYFPLDSSPNQNPQYWNEILTNNWSWEKSHEQTSATLLDDNIMNSYKYTLFIYLNDNYELVKKVVNNNGWNGNVNIQSINKSFDNSNNTWGGNTQSNTTPNNTWFANTQSNTTSNNTWGGNTQSNTTPNNTWGGNTQSNTTPNNTWFANNPPQVPTQVNGNNTSSNTTFNSNNPTNVWDANNTINKGFNFTPGNNNNWEKPITQNNSNPWSNIGDNSNTNNFGNW